MFPKLRKRLLLAILLLITLICLGARQIPDFHNVVKFNTEAASFSFRQHDLNTRQELHYSKYKFVFTDAFEEAIGGWDAFASKSKAEKCISFFRLIDRKLPGWGLESFENRNFEKDIVNQEKYFKSKIDNIREYKSQMTPPGEITDTDRAKVNNLYLKALADTILLEQDMADSMTILRIFGHCFFTGDVNIEGELADLYHKYSSKVSPFFAPKIPLTSSKDEWDFASRNTIANSNLLDYYYKNMKGTGIALSAATRYSTDIVRLIHVLRALNNTLPIEIFHRSDLLRNSVKSIHLAASLSKEDLLGEEMSNKAQLERSLENAGVPFSKIEDLEFPTQKVTIIDIQTLLSNAGTSEFSGYNNKLLALFFNSFEKVLLFDTDAVPLLTPDILLTMEEFTSTGAYFFRDRSLMETNDWIETNFFAKMMPHKSNTLDMAMGIKPVTNHTFGNNYMKGWRHNQEAGLVMLDRKRHFRSLVTLLPLAFWKEPIKSLIWGDKEMYWLAMSMAGDEEYTFNHYGAASVGEITSNPGHKHYNNTKAIELCSSHPGHVSVDGQLLWVNSGMAYCKKNGFFGDKDMFPFYLFEDSNQAEMMYEGPLKVRHAIVPPGLPSLRAKDGSPDMSTELRLLKNLKKRKKDIDDDPRTDQIDKYDPQKGWIKHPACSGYQHCAYNAIESFDGSGSLEFGQLFKFDAQSVSTFDILGAIWDSALRVPKLSDKAAKLEATLGS